MKNKPLKKSLALFLSLLMVMTSLVYAVPSMALAEVQAVDGNEVKGYVTIDPVIYTHGTYGGSSYNGEDVHSYDYMMNGSTISDGSYAGEFHTNVSVNGKNLSSITCVDSDAKLSISPLSVWDTETNTFTKETESVLTGDLGGGYASNTMDTKDSTATLKFTFSDGTYELRTLYVKTNPVAQHAITYAECWNQGWSLKVRVVNFEVLALGSYGQKATADTYTGKGNISQVAAGAATASTFSATRDADNNHGIYNFPKMYAPCDKIRDCYDEAEIDGLTKNQITVDKVAGCFNAANPSKSHDDQETAIKSPVANYYLDLSSSVNSGIKHTAGTSDWSINMFVGNMYNSKVKDAATVSVYEQPSTTTGEISANTGTFLDNGAFNNNTASTGYSTISGTATAGSTINGTYMISYKQTASNNPKSNIGRIYMPFQITVVDKSAVRNLYNEYVAKASSAVPYTPESWNTYSKALRDAEYYLNNYEISTENESAIINKLESNYKGLKKKEFTVNYYDVSNTENPLLKSEIVEYGEIVKEAPTPTKASDQTNHYTFSNWTYKNGTGVDITTQVITENVDLYAAYTGATHIIKTKQENVKDATCDSDGSYTEVKYCSVCNYELSRTEGITVNAKGHKWVDKVDPIYILSTATCTAPAVYYKSCSACGKSAEGIDGTQTFTSGDPIGHKMEKTDYKAATCEEAGNNEYWTCSVCKNVYSDETGKTATTVEDMKISAKGHTWAEVAEDKYCKTEATCTAQAVYYKSCSVCGKSSKGTDYEATFSAGDLKDHDFSVMNVASKYLVSSATCEGKAVYYYSCSACSASSKGHTNATFEYGTANGHKLAKTARVEATCLKDGNIEYWTCSVCGKIFSDYEMSKELTEAETVIAKLQHSYTGAIKKDSDGENGTHSYKCVNGCNEYGNPTAHSWNDGVIEPDSTCTDEGTKTYTCTVVGCGATYTEDIPAKGHSMTKTDAKPATCEEAGNKAYWTCSVCNKVFEDEEGKTSTTVAAMTIEANGHVYGDLIAEVPATCEGTGTKAHYTCSACEKNFDTDKNELTDLVISAKGHKFTEETATADYLKSKATCTELAVYYKSCSTCKKSAEGIDNSKTFTSGETKDHKFGKYESFDDADKHNLICSECNNAYGTADHNWVKNEAESFDPTYDNDGKTVSDCKDCGQKKEEKVEKKTDSTAPTASIKWNATIWNSFLTSITFGNYVNYDVTLEISAEDNESGLASTQYYVSNNALTLEEVKAIADWTIYDSNKKLTVSKNDSDKFVVYAKVTDNSGNITYVSTEGFNVDKIAPVIEVSGKGSNNVYCESATVKVTDTNLKTVTVDSEPVELTEGAYIITTAGEHKIVATDMAGNETEKTITVNAEHSWGDPEVIGAPTCTDKGENKYTCTVCGGTKTEEINALGHNTSKVDAKDATCTEDGNKEYYTCSRCDKLFEDEDAETETTLESVTIKAAHSWEDDFTIDKAATCEEAGSKSIHCSKCDAKQNETTIDALGHKFTNETVDEKYLASAATCTEKAKYYKSCSVCEKSSKDTDGEATFETGEALGHDFTIEVEGTKTAATCKETGSVTMKCSRCDETTIETLEIDPNNHQGETQIRDDKTANCHEKGYTGDKYCLDCETKIETGTETEIDKNKHDGETQVRDTVTATCCEAGYTGDTYCLGCNDKIADGQATEKDPSNHKSTETYLRDDEAATCTSEGYTGDTYHKCCDTLKSKGETIPMIAHTWVDEVKDEYLASAATCTAKATYYKSCSVCGAKGTETFETGEKLEHSYTGEVQPTGNGNHVFKCVNGCENFGGQEDCYGGTAVCGSKANCEKCNAPYGEVKAHNYGNWTPNEEGGHTKTCSDCDAETNGHSVSEPHNWDKGEITTPATCGAEGVKTYTCKDCYATKTEPTGAKDPNNHVGETVIKNAKASTCKTEGYTGDVYCKGCMQKISGGTTIAVDPNNHTWGKWGTDKEATCIEEGVSKRVCKECGIDETQPIEKNPDNHVDVTEGVGRKDPTCTEPGYVGATVCACGHVIEQGTYLEALGHEPGAYEIKVMPTEDGVKGKAVSICTRCGIVLGEKEIAYGDVHFVAFYDYNGVRLIKPRYYIYGDKVVRPANDPVRPDDDKNTYKFIGWNYSENELNCVTKEMAVVAQYEAIEKSYTVTFFDANGNPITVPSSSPILYSDIVKSYTGETPTKAEDSEYTYTFSGWAISCDQSTGEASVYPQFTATAKVNEDEEPNEGIFGWLIRLIRKIIAWFKGE